MERHDRRSADRIRALLHHRRLSRAVFTSALARVPRPDRDAWIDRVMALHSIPDDGPALPRGCVPYLPCPVEAIQKAVALAAVQPTDVIVDVGAGVGRAAALLHLLTQAPVVGLEIQPQLLADFRDLRTRLRLDRLFFVEGDAAELAPWMTSGSVFFFYCPFSGPRLARVLEGLAPLAAARQLRLCCVDLPLPPRPWLTPVTAPDSEVMVYQSAPVPASALRRHQVTPARGATPRASR